MYVCGPTVYDEAHTGHARTYVAFDAVRRTLELLGYEAFYVQNITGIDDKIINRAERDGVTASEVAGKYTILKPTLGKWMLWVLEGQTFTRKLQST